MPGVVTRNRGRYAWRMSDEGDAPVPNSPATKAAGPTNLAAKMAKARKERNVTQGQLADRLHIKQAMVSMIEGGEAEYSTELAGRIRSWIDSGAGALKKSARGPYKTRSTIQGRE